MSNPTMLPSEAAVALVSSLPKRRKKAMGSRADTVRKDFDTAVAIAKSEDRWKEMNARMLVALYGWLHLQVYGVDAAPELAGKPGLGAKKAAKRMLEEDFSGNVGDMLRFMRWCWAREQEKEEWRKTRGYVGQRITWALQFGPRLLVDFRRMMRRFEPMPSVTRVAEPVLDHAYAIETPI